MAEERTADNTGVGVAQPGITDAETDCAGIRRREPEGQRHIRLRILVSAYACQPGGGSEPGIGWNWVRQFARWHDVFVITRRKNRHGIEAAIAAEQLDNITPIYVDWPGWARFWKKGQIGTHVYYHVWQLFAWISARRLLQRTKIDIAHHITLGMYWKPSMLAFLPVPFVLGPVGGGEDCPAGFWTYFGVSHFVYESMRWVSQTLSRLDPFVRRTARTAVYSLATTGQTEKRLRELGCSSVQIVAQMALPSSELEILTQTPIRASGPLRIFSAGRLLHWKGFELALKAFAGFRAGGGVGEYWIIGDGPAHRRLMRTARMLGISDAVRCLPSMQRSDLLRAIAECDVLVHPSLHDSGGWICIEAMAAGRPVICLDSGGPALAVSPDTGVAIPVTSPETVVQQMTDALLFIGRNRDELVRMGTRARERAAKTFTWDSRGDQMNELLQTLVNAPST